MITIQDRLG